MVGKSVEGENMKFKNKLTYNLYQKILHVLFNQGMHDSPHICQDCTIFDNVYCFAHSQYNAFHYNFVYIQIIRDDYYLCTN